MRAALVLLMLSLAYWRARTHEEVMTIRFDDLPEPAVATLGLAGE